MKSERPLVPGGRAVDAREHEVDDVLGEVVVAAGDEDLGAADARSVPSARLRARSCARADVASRRAAR